MSAKHTPEPWGKNSHGIQPASDFRQVPFVDYARAAACVNACEGINPDAVPDMLKALKRVASLNEHAGEIGPGMLATIVADARAALVKAGGNSAGIQKGNNSEPPKFSNYHEDEALLSRDW